MSEQTAPTTGTENTNNEQQAAAAEFQAITSQEDFDKAIQARIARERAKFADYEELKARADKLAEFEESQKTEAQKTQERLEAAERRASEMELRTIRAEVANAKGIPAELLSGSTQEELEASAEKLIAFKGTDPQRLVVKNEGRAPGTAHTPADAFASHLKSQLGR